ncbi:MAG: tRNA (adenosine(37)-N6)-threonylcarbamoyltransferase complex ATPase subunit type 1 TsaE [Planctomycetes bacterium]|nr:tRNA (adenosine(37)-N6)-threonylcarbamoyltransferase complex ATPase subunit type 1 TsaE [Planctomycetota bacterium]
MIIKSNSVKETVTAGAELAKRLKPGMLVALTGIFGAGKTYFIKGIAKGLGVKNWQRSVTSPSFVLMNIHQGREIRLYHIDVHRLDKGSDFYGLGAEDALGDGVVAVEWAEKIKFRRKPDVTVEIRHKSAGKRVIEISGMKSQCLKKSAK